MDLNGRFGRRVRHLRLASGLTQQTLAEAINLSPVSISNIERGVHAPGFRRLEDLAAALRVELHELFVFDGLPDMPDGE